MRSAGEIFGEAAAAARRNETSAIFVFIDIGVEALDDVITEGAIEVKMKLYLGKYFHNVG